MNFNAWLTETEAIDEEPRAVRAWNHINDKPTSVAFRKPDGTTLDAQTVRLESDNSASESEAVSGAAPVRKLVIFGVANHPDSGVADTDIGEGYRFVHQNDAYRVVDVIETLGEVQGIAEATG